MLLDGDLDFWFVPNNIQYCVLQTCIFFEYSSIPCRHSRNVAVEVTSFKAGYLPTPIDNIILIK